MRALVPLLLLVGCAHEQGPNPQVLTKLQGIAPKGIESGVVVLYGKTTGTLWIDDRPAGAVFGDRYNVIELPVGRHAFRVGPRVTVVSVVGGETKYLALEHRRFQPGARPEVVAADFTPGLELDLTAPGRM